MRRNPTVKTGPRRKGYIEKSNTRLLNQLGIQKKKSSIASNSQRLKKK